MSQKNVERLIGRVLTDEPFRERFLDSPLAALDGWIAEGWELHDIEREALAALDPGAIRAFARGVDARIRKVSLSPTLGTARPDDPNPEDSTS